MLAATGVLRGLQDTRTPLLVAVAANGANVVLNLVLVYGVGRVAGLGLAGSALGHAAGPARRGRRPGLGGGAGRPARAGAAATRPRRHPGRPAGPACRWCCAR